MIIHHYTGANADDRVHASLCKIWLSGFDDTPEYFDLFYNSNVHAGQAEVFYAFDERSSDILGAAYLLGPCLLPYAGENHFAYYGYAFSVLPDYRGTGVYAALSDAFRVWARAQGAGVFLYPANNKLLEYYTKNGAAKNLITRRVKLDHTAFGALLACGGARSIGADEAETYAAIRNAHFTGCTHLLWCERAIRYAIQENLFCGGFCKMLTVSGAKHVIFGREEADCVIIKETTLPDAILVKFGAKPEDFETASLASYDMPQLQGFKAGLLLD